MTYEDLKRIYVVLGRAWSELYPESNNYADTPMLISDIEWSLNCIDEELTILERNDNDYVL